MFKKTIKLYEEKLDITKTKQEINEVNVFKNTFNDSIIVPVTHEELIIETKNSDNNVEVIKIPISEEQVEIKKYSKVTENVNVYLKQFKENQHINETLKKEIESIKFKEEQS